MRKLKHLPLEQWPAGRSRCLQVAYQPGDIFDESRGPGAHHSEGWRRMIRTTYRRWLGFLTEHYPADLLKRLRSASRPNGCGPSSSTSPPRFASTTVAMAVAHLYAAAGLIAPAADWRWLSSLKARLAGRVHA